MRYIPLEDLIANHLGDLFPGMEILDHHAFRLTRNEDVEIEEDETENLIQALEEELLRRRFGPPIRLEITDDMDELTLDLLISELDITAQEVYRLPAPARSRRAVRPRQDRPARAALPAPTCPPPRCSFQPAEPNGRADIFEAIRRADVLVHHPYESFATSVQAFLEQAAADPHVLAIKQTLYRTSGDSPIVAGAHRRRRVGQAGARARRGQGPIRRSGEHRRGRASSRRPACTSSTASSG